MKEQRFEKKIRKYSRMQRIVFALTVFNFFGATLLVDSTVLSLIFAGISFICFIGYTYASRKNQAYQKALYYYRKHIYNRPIRLKRA